MTYQVRVDPDQSPTVAFSPEEIATLERLATTQKPARQAGQPLTLREAVRAMAKLGGFLGRKSDGEPGGENPVARISLITAPGMVGQGASNPVVKDPDRRDPSSLATDHFHAAKRPCRWQTVLT